MPDVINKALELLDEWLKAEDETIEMTNKISQSTDNDAIKIFMTIIRTDSAKHKLIQNYLKDALTKGAPAMAFNEIAEVSGMINDHLALEQKTVDFGEEIAGDLNLPVIGELWNYLLDDEKKHVTLLNALAKMKEFAQKNT